MKKLAAILATAALSGCASFSNQPDTTRSTNTPNMPSYSYRHQAIIAQGFPLEYLEKPAGMNINYNYDNELPVDGGGSVYETGFVWVSSQGNTAVMTSIFRRANQATLIPNFSSMESTQVGGMNILHITDTGRYFDLVFWKPSLRTGFPQCAIGTAISIVSSDRQRELGGEYVEGVPCGELSSITHEEREEHLDRAFMAFGLSRG
ncbi:hypothetical protein HPA02_27050 [Bisbaumannia pacifica]|uniref:Lipoprotein n=1 Tax=Bisbaumannia pacifica TaxID=77098 RepID=A0A510XAG5_9GAMM|nr:hypothetical protein [Halomonas pacifica]GEK48422.1 hypothetical protein HPA02_27050 [Halomonas pacifica]